MESKHITLRLPVVLIEAMQAEAAERSSMVRRVSWSEVARETLVASFLPDGVTESLETVTN